MPGKPDFVFPKARLALFIDGDFWHGHPKNYRPPKTNAAFWKKKIQKNRQRDRAVNALLKAKGWAVLRIWESSLAKRPRITVARIQKKLHETTQPISPE